LKPVSDGETPGDDQTMASKLFSMAKLSASPNTTVCLKEPGSRSLKSSWIEGAKGQQQKIVMPGLVPAIHVFAFASKRKDVDGRAIGGAEATPFPWTALCPAIDKHGKPSSPHLRLDHVRRPFSPIMMVRRVGGCRDQGRHHGGVDHAQPFGRHRTFSLGIDYGEGNRCAHLQVPTGDDGIDALAQRLRMFVVGCARLRCTFLFLQGLSAPASPHQPAAWS